MPYKTYRNLPPLAGLCSMEDAQRPGLSVEECVTRLKRFHYCFKRLHEIFTARITAEPIYELKTGVQSPRIFVRRTRDRTPQARRRDARAAAGPRRCSA